MKSYLSIFIAGVLCASPLQASAQSTDTSTKATPPIRIYLDADRSVHTESALAIEMGIKTAFAEVNSRIQGRKVEFVALDHRGNSTRSKLNMKKAFADEHTLLVMAGLHSPPLIKNRSFINENQMLTMVPWAAGGPITRHPSPSNWVFRLSIDDTKAGYRIANFAIQQDHCKAPQLLLEKTPWGESNQKTMSTAIKQLLNKTPAVEWFNWGISEENARIKLRAIGRQGADCLLFVGNANDGAAIMRAMASLPPEKRLAVYSHWGITGGKFHEILPEPLRQKIKLKFIQTCFSFVSSPSTALSQQVFSQAQTLFPQLGDAKALKAPAGFIHAYDSGRILIQALKQVTLGDDMAQNRTALKQALEDLQTPVQGLIKNYNKPFASFSAQQTDAHEALGLDDFCMARYGSDDEIIVLPNR